MLKIMSSFLISKNGIFLKLILKLFINTSFVETAFHFAYKARIVEQIFSISKTHEKYCLFSKRNISEFIAAKKFSYLHIGMV